MLFSNGTWQAKVVTVSVTTLSTYSYYPYLGNATLEPSNLPQTITLGDFVLGSVNNATFVISSRSVGEPAAMVRRQAVECRQEN